MSLAILIPTLPNRYAMLKRLQSVLLPQLRGYEDRVSIHYNDAGRSMTTGEKRNRLIAACGADYFAFVDDDDLISSYYVKEMLNALEKGPDVVTFIGHMTTDGLNRRDFTIKLGEKYEERNGHYYRFPNHLCAFRKDLVKHVKFPHISQQEDYKWAKQIHDLKLLKYEVHINKEMYHYDFRTKK